MNRPLTKQYDLVTVAKLDGAVDGLTRMIRQADAEHGAKLDGHSRDVADRLTNFEYIVSELMKAQGDSIGAFIEGQMRNYSILADRCQRLEDRTLGGRWRRVRRWVRVRYYLVRAKLARRKDDDD